MKTISYFTIYEWNPEKCRYELYNGFKDFEDLLAEIQDFEDKEQFFLILNQMHPDSPVPQTIELGDGMYPDHNPHRR